MAFGPMTPGPIEKGVLWLCSQGPLTRSQGVEGLKSLFCLGWLNIDLETGGSLNGTHFFCWGAGGGVRRMQCL